MSERERSKLKRHRHRDISLDLNRSPPQVKEKYKKDNRARRMPPPVDFDMVDMSRTINAPNSNTGARPKTRSQVQNPDFGTRRVSFRDEAMPQSVKQMVNESVEEMRRSLDNSIRNIVSDNVSRELGKVHDSITMLSDAIRSLALKDTARENDRTNIPPPNVTANSVHARAYDLPPPSDKYSFPNVHPNWSNVQQQPMMTTAPPPVVPPSHYVNKTRVDRFGLRFDGNENHLSIESFVFRLEYCQRQYQIPWKEILDDFHLLVVGPALDWYWLHVETTRVTQWEDLRMSMLSRFRTHRTNLDIMHELVERKQNPGESIDQYFHQINLLRSKLETPISEFEMIKLAKKNLRESVARIVYPIAISSLEQLRVEAVEAERNFPRREVRNAPIQPQRKYVNEVDVNYESDEIDIGEVAEINTPIVCWNCQKQGHIFMDCPSAQRAMFCYRCGKPDVISPNCPKCKEKGNSKRSAISTGESRSSRNAPNPQNYQQYQK